MLDEVYCSVPQRSELQSHRTGVLFPSITQSELNIGAICQPVTLSRRLVTESAFVSFLFPQPRNCAASE
jgi:hypothetical protein